MGLDIGGNTFTQASSVLTINTGVPMRVLSAGSVVRPNQVLFIVRGASADWVNLANGWNFLTTFTNIKVNAGGCYSGSRFTAPVDGMYFLQMTGGHYLKDGASISYYWHPLFGVNGSEAGRTATAQANLRLRGHGVSIASYEDGSVTQIYKLFAGDYVQPAVYSNGSPLNRIYPNYQQWSGFLLG